MSTFKIDFNAIENGATQGSNAGIVLQTTLTPTTFMKNQIYLRSPVMSRQQFIQDMLGLGKHLYEIQKNNHQEGQVEFYIRDDDCGFYAVDRQSLMLKADIPVNMDVVISTAANTGTSSIVVRIAHPQNWQHDVYGARFGTSMITGGWFTRPGIDSISIDQPYAYAIALLEHGAVFWLPQVANDANGIPYHFSLKDPAVFFTELRSIEDLNYSELGMFVPLRKLRDTDYPNESLYNNHTETFDRNTTNSPVVTAIKQEYVTTSYSSKVRTDFGGLCLYPSLKNASVPYELYSWTLFYQQQALSSTGLLTNMVTTNPPFYAPYLYLKETNTENLYGKVKFNDEEFIAASCWAAKITHDEE